MTTNRIGFRNFLNKVSDGEGIKIIVDSNVIIAYFDEIHSQHENVSEFIDVLDNKANVSFYTTVTTKSEFLDYQRRKLLTLGLIALTEEYKNEIKINKQCQEKIKLLKNRKSMRLGRENQRADKGDIEESDVNSSLNYFRDSDLKEIKKVFRARDIQGEAGWLNICSKFLKKRLLRQEQILDEFCQYLSTRDESQIELFQVDEINWNQASELSAETGMGYSDAMILNMSCSTNIEYIATLDFDLVYGGALRKEKRILLPDNRISNFKKILKTI